MQEDKIDAQMSDFLSAQVVVFDWTPGADPEVTCVSANVAGLLGCEAVPQNLSLSKFIAAQDRDRFMLELGQIQEAPGTVGHEAFRLLLPNDLTRWVHAHSCLGPIDGSYRTFVFAHDAIHHSESAREESEARYQQIFDTNLAVKLLIDPADGRIQEANQAAARFYGYSRKQLEQMNISAINMLSESEISQEMSLARTEERLFFNFRHRLASGEVRDVEVFSGPVTWQQSRLLYSIVFDVTERNRIRKSLEEKQNDLGRTLKELQLAQKQLVQRERLAAVGQFTAGIAHDFNNLLTGILTTAEFMKLSDNLTDEQQDDVDVIVRSGERAASMIRQLLDFCSQSSSECHAVDLGALVHESAAFLRSSIPDTITLRLQVDDDQSVHANATQLQQVLTNLIFNARDSMPDGGELSVSVREVTIDNNEQERCALCQANLSGNWVRLEVADMGHGIEIEDLPRIFEPFFTLNRSRQGSGLGLAQVAGIVNQHDGHIAVSSSPKNGTAFRVYLPPHSNPLTPSEAAIDAEAPRLGGGQRILLVEDEPVVRHAVAKMLSYLNYQVVLSSDGQEAIEIFQNDSDFDLVLSDIVMPKMDGLKLLARLKESRPTMPVVLMSGYPAVDDDQSRADMNVSWLTKPLNLHELAEAIETALGVV